MRELFVCIVGVIALGGCSMTVAESVPVAHHAKSYTVHFQTTQKPQPLVGSSSVWSFDANSAGGGARENDRQANVDTVGGIIAQARALPSLLRTIRNDLTIAFVVLGSLALLNIALLARVLMRRGAANETAARNDVMAVDSIAAVAAVEPDVRDPREDDVAQARCACDAPISSRSRTGRCRSCARRARTRPTHLTQPARPTQSTQPKPPIFGAPSTLAIVAPDDNDDDVVVPRATLTASRLGSRREYYSVVD